MAVSYVTPKSNVVRLNSQTCELYLHSQEIQHISGHKPTIYCTDGMLWVTQRGDPKDYILNKGEMFTASHSGLVLVQAIKNAACTITRN